MGNGNCTRFSCDCECLQNVISFVLMRPHRFRHWWRRRRNIISKFHQIDDMLTHRCTQHTHTLRNRPPARPPPTQHPQSPHSHSKSKWLCRNCHGNKRCALNAICCSTENVHSISINTNASLLHTRPGSATAAAAAAAVARLQNWK